MMNKTLEKLWNEYFAGECAVMDSDEERELAKKAVEMHKAANELLTKEQSDAIEEYVDILCEIQCFFAKKAFFKGCEFTTSLFFETWNS
ncbi:MAG: hypothetical protein IJY23_06700 [Clostridia bacterium]|nr:hypothetical protein [Clostridia bacterium]